MFFRGSVSQAQTQGPRSDQEDFFLTHSFRTRRGERGHLLGVMDGHDGEAAAKLCAHIIPQMFDPNTDGVAFELRNIIARLVSRTFLFTCGTTLSLACIHESRRTVTTAVLGDSPIIVVDGDGITHVSDEHNVRTNQKELAAAISRGAVYKGGFIFNAPNNDYGLSHTEGLQMSRALGDHTLHRILSREPTIESYTLGRNSLVIIASDGVFDPAHGESNPNAVKTLVDKAYESLNATEILKWREHEALEDNATIVLWRPRPWWHVWN